MDRTEYITSLTPTGRTFAQVAAAMLVGMVIGSNFAAPVAKKAAAGPESGTVWTQAHADIPNAPVAADVPATF